MRAVFYSSEKQWNGSSRALVAAAHGVMRRGHEVALVCPGGSTAARRADALGVETLPADPDATAAGDAWFLRRVMHKRGIEVVFIHGDRDQVIVSSAMRLGGRGAVIRRIPSFAAPALSRPARVAVRLAATGLLFSTEDEATEAEGSAETTRLRLNPAVGPLGVDVAGYDAVRPAARAALDVPTQSLLVLCSYEPTARLRLANVMRTIALLRPRHPEIHLAVLGPGSLDDDLRMHAAALGVSTCVTFLGHSSDDLAVLRAADVGWVVAGGDDGAYAFLDLMAMRIPVLAERSVMPQHYVTDGATGVLLSPGAPSHTAASVARFLVHADRRAAMGNAARTRVQRDFGTDAMAEGFERAMAAAGDRSRWVHR